MLRWKVAATPQLLSLAQWQQQSLAAGELAQAAWRSFATEAPSATRAVRFAKERKSYETSLSELRKQWAQERQERAEAAAVQEAADRCCAVRAVPLGSPLRCSVV